MEVKTYRAATMHDALALVRRELGPDAAVLHTREVRTSRWFGLLPGATQIEVMATVQMNVPSRLPPRMARAPATPTRVELPPSPPAAPAPPPSSVTEEMKSQLSQLESMVRQLCRQSPATKGRDLPDALFRLYTDLIEADIDEDLARQLVEQVQAEAGGEALDPLLVRARIARIVESQIATTGPIRLTPGQHRLVALIGPTGVGKTTTIAKLAAHYRLREHRRVGLITVDTYRIAAVEQLRTYADIIDLPMQVVSSPREMREAVRRLSDQDLILMDTAGRSPKDDVKIRELRAFLTEAAADEVHLVLSTVAHPRTLEQTAEKFAPVGTTALILTKLDEAAGLGNLLPLLRRCRAPVSYLTNGQNVPDDIEVADSQKMSRLMLQTEMTFERPAT